jgi:catechol 2,3-dioxygenase-like lactoylglutathione lyase family enzyme
MVANVNGPHFSGGANIAIKCPSHTYEQTLAFYRDTLGLPLIEEEDDGCIFQFGPNRLWIDRVPNLSHPDIWLELETNDTEAAASYLKINGIPRRDEVEQLREDFDGFWISDPAGVFHLVVGDEVCGIVRVCHPEPRRRRRTSPMQIALPKETSRLT